MILRDVKVLRLTAIAFLIDVDEVARNVAQGTKIIGYTQYTSTQREVS